MANKCFTQVFFMLFCRLLIFLKTFFKIFFRNIIIVRKGLDPDRDRRSDGPDLGSNCLQRLSASPGARTLHCLKITPSVGYLKCAGNTTVQWQTERLLRCQRGHIARDRSLFDTADPPPPHTHTHTQTTPPPPN